MCGIAKLKPIVSEQKVLTPWIRMTSIQLVTNDGRHALSKLMYELDGISWLIMFLRQRPSGRGRKTLSTTKFHSTSYINCLKAGLIPFVNVSKS